MSNSHALCSPDASDHILHAGLMLRSGHTMPRGLCLLPDSRVCTIASSAKPIKCTVVWCVVRLLTGIVLGSDNEAFQRDACELLDFTGGDEELGPAIEERLQVAAAAACCLSVVTARASACQQPGGR